jgi:hypothetical protein
MRGNNSLCTGAFQLLRGRAPAQLRGNIGPRVATKTPYPSMLRKVKVSQRAVTLALPIDNEPRIRISKTAY